MKTLNYDNLPVHRQIEIDDEEPPGPNGKPLFGKDRDKYLEQAAKALKAKDRLDAKLAAERGKRKPFGHDGRLRFHPEFVRFGCNDAFLIGGLHHAMAAKMARYKLDAEEWHTPAELVAYLGCSRMQLWRILGPVETGKIDGETRLVRRGLERYLSVEHREKYGEVELFFRPTKAFLALPKPEYVQRDLCFELGLSATVLYNRIWAACQREYKSGSDGVPVYFAGKGFSVRWSSLCNAMPWVEGPSGLKQAMAYLQKRGVVRYDRVGRRFIYRVQDWCLSMTEEELTEWLRGGEGVPAKVTRFPEKSSKKPNNVGISEGGCQKHRPVQVTGVPPNVTGVPPNVTGVPPNVTGVPPNVTRSS